MHEWASGQEVRSRGAKCFSVSRYFNVCCAGGTILDDAAAEKETGKSVKVLCGRHTGTQKSRILPALAVAGYKQLAATRLTSMQGVFGAGRCGSRGHGFGGGSG